MTIDLKSEKAISLAQAARLIPPTRLDKPVHVSTVLRWILHGVRGVRLEAARIGGRWVTTHSALERFSEALTSQRATPPAQALGSGRSAGRRSSDPRQVERQLAGWGL